MNVILSKEQLIKKAGEVLKDHFAGITLHSEAMMVGGTVRDILLGRTPKDIDIATPDTISLVEAFSNSGFTHVVLDDERDIHRMVGKGVHIDITPLRDGQINDLFSRDFTINSIGLVIQKMEVLDPQGGIKDLSKGIVRALSENRFLEDPLRLIRAFRIAADLGFDIDPVTKRFITKHAHLIAKPSKERVRDELCWTLESPRSHPVIEELTKTGMLGRILPEFANVAQVQPGKPHALGLTEHLIWTLKYLEDIFNELDETLNEHAETTRELLSQTIASSRMVYISIKLAALLHDVGKPITATYDDEPHFIDHERVGAEMVAKRLEELKFSRAEIDTISGIVLHHMRPHNLQKLETVTPKAVFRYFRDLDQLAIPTMLVALADAYATQMIPFGNLDNYEEFVRTMISASVEMGKPKPLLSGDEVIKLLKIEPGPEVGSAISALVESQALGEIKTKDEATEFILKRKNGNKADA